MATQVSSVFAALRSKARFEVVSHNETPGQLRILGRVPEDSTSVNNWKIVMYRLLMASEQRPWKIDISKSYFIKKETKKMVFGWRVLLQGADIKKHYADVQNIILSGPNARFEVTEIPLAGGADRNNTSGGRRGAGPEGTVAVGPAAAYAKMRGG